MVLTRDFKKTIMERVARDEQYRKGLLTEAVNKLLEGNLNVGKAMLRDYNNATITSPTLAQKLNKSSNSIRRMLGPVLHDLQQDGDLLDPALISVSSAQSLLNPAYQPVRSL